MVNTIMRRFAPAAMVATIALAAAAGSAKATEITFGTLSPTGLGGCSHVSGDAGLVCGAGEVGTRKIATHQTHRLVLQIRAQPRSREISVTQVESAEAGEDMRA